MLFLQYVLLLVVPLLDPVSAAAFLMPKMGGFVTIATTKSYISFVVSTNNNKRIGKSTNRFVSSLSDHDENENELKTMKISEIKAELELRGVSINDCFDKESLVARLQEARISGKADPELLDQFNKKKLEAIFKEGGGDINDEMFSDDRINAVLSSDGNLPGGLAPNQLKKLVRNPDLMTMLQSVKVQEIMKLMMTSGPEALQKAMEEDINTKQLVMKLSEVMAKSLL